jgi:hypothetical protein
MNALRNAVRGIGTIWSHGDEDDFADEPEPQRDETSSAPTAPTSQPAQTAYTPSRYQSDKAFNGPSSGSSASATRRPRAVPYGLATRKEHLHA